MITVHFLFVLISTLYCVFHTYQRRKKISCMTGMMIAMTLAMVSSLSVGLLFGIWYYPDLNLPTFIGVAIGIVVGFLTGKPVSLMAAMDGMLAGLMGGMMGAMFGNMLTVPTPMIWFVDIIFSLMVLMFFFLIQEEEEHFEKTKNEDASHEK
jgi:hypothetical protein